MNKQTKKEENIHWGVSCPSKTKTYWLDFDYTVTYSVKTNLKSIIFRQGRDIFFRLHKQLHSSSVKEKGNISSGPTRKTKRRKKRKKERKKERKKRKKRKTKRKKGGTTVCMPEHNKQVITDTSLSLESFVTYIEKHFTWVGKEGKHFSKRKRKVLLKMFSYECNFCSSSCCCLRCNFA